MAATTTKLNALNTILSVVGEPPLNDLTGDASKNADAVLALNILDEIGREVQSSGWHFNTVKEVPLAPDSSGTIQITGDIARVDTELVSESRSYDLVLRGSTLYDRKNRTSVFTKTIKVTVVYLLDFENLPEVAKRFVTIRAARVFQDRLIGEPNQHSFNSRDELNAWTALREFEMDTGDHSIFDNYDVFRVVDRPSVYNRVQ